MQLEVKQDERGMLYEMFQVGNGQLFIVTIYPGFTRGNHYHKRKTEKFVVVAGSAVINCRGRKTGTYKSYICSADDPRVITITPNITHNIVSNDGCTIVCWASEHLDESDPDTYPEVV